MSRNLLVQLGRALEDHAILYMIIGGQAVLLYGEPRLTRDVDVTIGLTPEDLDRVLSVVDRVDLKLLVQEVEDFVHRTWVLPTLDEETGLRVDFIFSWTPYEREALRRAREIIVDGYPVKFASPEDVIIHKVLASRPRDLEDVRSILRKQRPDLNYIRAWLRQFDAALEGDHLTRFEAVLRAIQEEEKGEDAP